MHLFRKIILTFSLVEYIIYCEEKNKFLDAIFLSDFCVEVINVGEKRLKEVDRIKIAAMYNGGKTKKEIMEAIGCDLSTIYRELKRGGVDLRDRSSVYDAHLAQERAEAGLRRRGRHKGIQEGGKRIPSQSDRVLLHLEKYGSITSDEARELYGVSRLAARINVLRNQGVCIDTTYVRFKSRYGHVGRYARYILTK